VTSIPAEHIQDAHKLEADAEIDLFELTPNRRQRHDLFQGRQRRDLAAATPTRVCRSCCHGFKKSTDGSALVPKLTVGDGSIDLSPFKPLVYDGYLDGARDQAHPSCCSTISSNNRDIKERATTA
jgi:hypothetical protein